MIHDAPDAMKSSPDGSITFHLDNDKKASKSAKGNIYAPAARNVTDTSAGTIASRAKSWTSLVPMP